MPQKLIEIKDEYNRLTKIPIPMIFIHIYLSSINFNGLINQLSTSSSD